VIRRFVNAVHNNSGGDPGAGWDGGGYNTHEHEASLTSLPDVYTNGITKKII